MKPLLALSSLVLAAGLIPAAGYAAAQEDQTAQSQVNSATDQAQSRVSSPAATPANPAAADQDSSIASKIEAQMASQNISSQTGINVSADSSGVVSLTGSAHNQDDLDKVVSIAHNTAGVTAVNNSVKVQP